MKSFTLTPRLFAMLKELAAMKEISLKDAVNYNQITFGAFLKRGYLDYLPVRETFKITKQALEALNYFERAEILRSIQSDRLHSFFYSNIEKRRTRSKVVHFPYRKAS